MCLLLWLWRFVVFGTWDLGVFKTVSFGSVVCWVLVVVFWELLCVCVCVCVCARARLFPFNLIHFAAWVVEEVQYRSSLLGGSVCS